MLFKMRPNSPLPSKKNGFYPNVALDSRPSLGSPDRALGARRTGGEGGIQQESKSQVSGHSASSHFPTLAAPALASLEVALCGLVQGPGKVLLLGPLAHQSTWPGLWVVCRPGSGSSPPFLHLPLGLSV